MKILIFDPVGGASGDMILGSLIHLGCPPGHIESALASLGLGPFAMRLEEKMVHGIATLNLGFETPEQYHQRSYHDIRQIITDAPLEPTVRSQALAIFGLIAEAEAAVHCVAVEEVHFHEIGALDSIYDIVGISAALAWFNPAAVYATPLPLGTGITTSLHGPIPLPAPATMRLLEGLRVRYTGREGELVTPTGAAVIKAVAHTAPIPDTIVKSSGYGCGDREYADWPNLFRVVLGETDVTPQTVFVVETDVDDMSPEEWEAALEMVMGAGALDANLTPRIMKRGRPGVGLTAITSAARLQAVIQSLLAHTTSIGLRSYPVARTILERQEFQMSTRHGEVRVKEVVDPTGAKRRKVEYRDLHRIAREKGIPVARLRREIEADIEGQVPSSDLV